MFLKEFKFQTRGELLEAAELLGIKPDDPIPAEFQKLAILIGYAKSFAPNTNWSNVFQKHSEELRANPDIAFVTLLYTTSEPMICIPGLPLLDEAGNVVKSDSAVLESRTLHIESILRNLYGQSIQTTTIEKTEPVHDLSDPGTH